MKTRGGLAPDKYLSSDERRRLLEYVKAKADYARKMKQHRALVDELIVYLLDGSGLRANELCQLNIGDLPCSHGKNVIYVRNGKGSVARAVVINTELVGRLNSYVGKNRRQGKPDEPLLLNERGNRFEYVSLYSKIVRIGRQAGLKLHPHIFRHTYATRLYGVEHDLYFTQDQLGHASPITTAIYAKTDNESKNKQVAMLT
jgi:integrase/recombinase XerD